MIPIVKTVYETKIEFLENSIKKIVDLSIQEGKTYSNYVRELNQNFENYLEFYKKEILLKFS